MRSKSNTPRNAVHLVFPLLAAAMLLTSAQAKDAPVTAVALFDGPAGPAYAQIAGLMLNGKSELKICDGVPRINKTAYDSLPKTQLAGAVSLERIEDGTLMLNANGKNTCVVPSNLKFERNVELTTADAADQAVLQGTIVSSSLSSSSSTVPGSDLPPFKRGVRLIFVAAADDELAQYLLSQRVNSIAGWQDFLAHHESSAHTAEARNALAGIHEQAADAAFAKYQKSATGTAVDLIALKQAEQEAVEANKVVAGYPAAAQLKAQINKELDTLLEPDRARLQAFRKALAEQTSDHAQLATARKHSEELRGINPEYAPVLNLHSEIAEEVRKLEAAVEKAEELAKGHDYDQALQSLGTYLVLAAEVPRIHVIVVEAYTDHFQRGRELAAQHDWEKAVTEFRRATEINKNSQEAATQLKDAESQWAAARDREAAQRALAKSRQYAADKDFISAYETLAELPDTQRAVVADQLTALQKDFIPAALRRAQKLQEIHVPMHGRADEDAVQEAYELLTYASAATGDPAIRLKLDLLTDKITAYYVDQGRRYLQKPMGSGVGVGWLYLSQAEHYRPNLSAVKDAMAQYGAAYQLRSRLSIGVVLRDQTSRRDSAGFADQLTDAIAAGLESSGLGVKVVRQPKEGADEVQPNFLLVGEIVDHRLVKQPNLETLQSKYRAGTHDVKNEDWNKANDDYSAAQKTLQEAQQGAANAHGKKEAAAANDAVTAAQKALDDARRKLDSTEPTRPQAVIETYNYTRRNIDLTATAELAFHISDAQGNLIVPSISIKKDQHKTFVVLENVKPEDTEGVKNQGTEPDEAQFLTDVEIQARDLLVKSVREKAIVLPAKILQEARNQAQQNNVDGAAEEYIVYLNATAEATSAERDEAAKFLREHYNLTIMGTSGPDQNSTTEARRHGEEKQ